MPNRLTLLQLRIVKCWAKQIYRTPESKSKQTLEGSQNLQERTGWHRMNFLLRSLCPKAGSDLHILMESTQSFWSEEESWIRASLVAQSVENLPAL